MVRVLSGDIGGTKTALAILEVVEDGIEVLARATYPSRDFGSLEAVVRCFLAEEERGARFPCELAGFGVAGPVRGRRAETTNLPWTVDAGVLESAAGLGRVWLLNDLEANAWGIAALKPGDLCVLNEGAPQARGNRAIVSAGTGLGQAGLFWDGLRHRPFASEGGHADFAPHSDREIALLRFLRQRHGHVSWERVVSGMGLVNIFEFLCEYRHAPPPAWWSGAVARGDAAAAISREAGAGCGLCREAMEMFVHCYGAEAGNHALKIMAAGGVYLGGGIAPRILDWLRAPSFLHAFCDKGRMAPLMRDMPVKVILNEHTALYGPALCIAAAGRR